MLSEGGVVSVLFFCVQQSYVRRRTSKKKNSPTKDDTTEEDCLPILIVLVIFFLLFGVVVGCPLRFVGLCVVVVEEAALLYFVLLFEVPDVARGNEDEAFPVRLLYDVEAREGPHDARLAVGEGLDLDVPLVLELVLLRLPQEPFDERRGLGVGR